MSENAYLLSRAGSVTFARCPMCDAHAVAREPGGPRHGPTDRCERCGHRFSPKPGTITVHQHVAAVAAGGGVMLSRAANDVGEPGR